MEDSLWRNVVTVIIVMAVIIAGTTRMWCQGYERQKPEMAEAAVFYLGAEYAGLSPAEARRYSIREKHRAVPFTTTGIELRNVRIRGNCGGSRDRQTEEIRP